MTPEPMRPPAARRVSRRSTVLFWAAVAILTTLLRAPALFIEVMDPDEAGHAVNAWVWMAGGTPYVDFADNKQPLLYATYAAVFTAFGRSLVAVHAITIPWLLLTAWLIGRLAARLWADETAARLAVVMFTLASVAYVEKDMLSTNTEVLMNLPLVAAFWALASPRTTEPRSGAIAAGALAAAAILFNLKAVVALPALAAAAVLVPPFDHRWRRVVLLATSLSAVLSLAALWFWQRGALAPFLTWNILRNFSYVGAGVGLGYAGYANGIVYGYPRPLAFAASTTPLWVGAAAALRVPLGDQRAKMWRLACALWAGGSVVAVCLGGRFYGHYFIQLIPPLAVLASGVVSSIRARRPLLHAAAVAGMIVPVLGWTAAGYARLAAGRLDAQQLPVTAVATAVRSLTGPDDRIFVWGYWPQLYYHARRLPASRFVFPQSLAGYVPGNPFTLATGTDPAPFIEREHWREFAEDMSRRPARLIVDTAPAAIHFWERYPVARYPVLSALLASRYERAAVVERVVIYRLRGETAE